MIVINMINKINSSKIIVDIFTIDLYTKIKDMKLMINKLANPHDLSTKTEEKADSLVSVCFDTSMTLKMSPPKLVGKKALKKDPINVYETKLNKETFVFTTFNRICHLKELTSGITRLSRIAKEIKMNFVSLTRDTNSRISALRIRKISKARLNISFASLESVLVFIRNPFFHYLVCK
jgi:hypothetical protein